MNNKNVTYEVEYEPSESEYETNQDRPVFKKIYDKFLEKETLMTAEDLATFLLTGRVISAKKVGTLTKPTSI